MMLTDHISSADCAYYPGYSVNIFLASCLSISLSHEVFKVSKILKFAYLKNGKFYWSEIKNISPSFTSVISGIAFDNMWSLDLIVNRGQNISFFFNILTKIRKYSLAGNCCGNWCRKANLKTKLCWKLDLQTQAEVWIYEFGFCHFQSKIGFP